MTQDFFPCCTKPINACRAQALALLLLAILTTAVSVATSYEIAFVEFSINRVCTPAIDEDVSEAHVVNYYPFVGED